MSILTTISSWLFLRVVRFWCLHQRVLDLCPGRGVLQLNLENQRGRKSFLLFVRNLIFQPQNPLSGAQQFVAKDPQDDDDLKLCSHTMMLPTRGQLEGRMIVTAYEHGLDNVTEEAVSAVVYAVENHLKDILTSVVSRRKAYRLRDGHFKYAFGSNVTPQPYLKNSVVAYNNLIESPPAFSAPCAGPNPASHPPPDDAEQQAALLLACSGDTLPASVPPVNMYDLFEALQVHREVIPTHTVYALNIERIIMKLWHPNHEELQQDKVHRQRLAAKEGLLLC
ncbi:transcriptional adapter 1 isoform X2 [Halichoerus grypus]|uniref:transcriptional adapter 1 isoform X2 n=1 Tax=Halichoerus grypus TaxID=9711 RepID=UPI0016598D68|nr:transcriptional adapter 1 isoform X2 [Halichoerus grypus]XP_035932620.1 transcriptional adapter 1 isoform X2 [Halichoerus grypus]XP_035932621.1 transcriptional adapter 1 isoform X2 [Halichoerus grypus]